ncbi:MAG: TIGR03435 family protein, partial [Acidobacteriaceae bacterium]|nr:TIGR03435 family protein [Acidobacteriaceae bacterium]
MRAAAVQTDHLNQFEVASVKENRSASGARIFAMQPGGRFLARNMSVRPLIGYAYTASPSASTGFPLVRIIGGPSWIDERGFDVEAKAGRAVTARDMRVMIQSMLADRFQLKWHEETRTMPIYSLVVDRKDQRLGDGLTPSAGPCTDNPASGFEDEKGLPRCSDRFPQRAMGKNLRIPLADTDMDRLADRLSSAVIDRPVVNATGLSGRFDIDFDYTP